MTKHHKHCSSWTLNTSGEKQPCDCVCECNHSMFEHVRPGEHYWYEDCAVEGCRYTKFTAAVPPLPQDDYHEEYENAARVAQTFNSISIASTNAKATTEEVREWLRTGKGLNDT